jgi:hypothetical protein
LSPEEDSLKSPAHRMQPTAIKRAIFFFAVLAGPTAAQVDQAKAAQYFREAARLCEDEGGRLWARSLCGPIVITDATTKTSATSRPAPGAPKPPMLGYANAAMDWGGTRWTTLVWQSIPADRQLRAKLTLHELFHRIQPMLGLLGEDGHNEHLDTLDGRYLVRLEWRALARALQSDGARRRAALADALAFRRARHLQFPGSEENERRLEINEGLAQYTATSAASANALDAGEDAAYQLVNASENATFMRTFPYASGAAYGLLLDGYSPGWRQRIKVTDDLSVMIAAAAGIAPAGDTGAIAARYGGSELRLFEERRDAERKDKLADLRKRFVDGPVVVLPAAKSSAFTTAGMFPIPGVGTLYQDFRASADWGTVEAGALVVSEDRKTLILQASAAFNPEAPAGDGWKLTPSSGWKLSKGPRTGDYVLTASPGIVK